VLVIRLTRTGKTSQESFRIVVAEQKKAVKREYLELLGHYLPTRNPKVLEYNKERILYWISKGAQPSETVASLLKAQGVQEMDQYIYFKTDRKSKAKKAGADEPAMPAATTPTTPAA
jgi:small subunit ribosomal protein S16